MIEINFDPFFRLGQKIQLTILFDKLSTAKEVKCTYLGFNKFIINPGTKIDSYRYK